MKKQQTSRHRFVTLFAVVFWLAIAATVLAIRLLIADGETRCVFSEDPALCATVAGVGR